MAVLMFFCWYYPIGLYRNAEPTDVVHERMGLLSSSVVEILRVSTSKFWALLFV
jgi:ATP-binding cassette subfamily G (WHITE) protein 2 (PDR)